MRTLDRKLLRELKRHWIQVTSIALVMACGTMTIMGLRSTLVSIRRARDDYFAANRFANVFAQAERVPSAVAPRLAAVPGVAAIETRIVRDVKLDVPGLDEIATGHVVSIPETRRPMLNELHLRHGRWVAPGRTDEVLVSERFASVNGLQIGDSLSAVINGRWQRLHVVGIALSPEFVIEFAGGAMFFDNRRYGVLWASARALETAFDMKGAFNDVAVRLAPGASEQGVIAALDDLLVPYGSAGAYGRRDQVSTRVLEDEFTQLRTNALIFPLFFLLVAAFLLNVVLSRLIASQRDEIAALKAFGFSHREVGAHYLTFALAAVGLGALLGVPLGMWMGSGFTKLYAEYFRFPSLPAVVDWGSAVLGVGVSAGFALLGALGAVRRVMALPPAEALRPESPGRFRPLLIERLGLGRLAPPNVRMVVRNLERRPLRTVATIVGIALAVALLAAGRFPYDAFDRLLFVEFHLSQEYDAAVRFIAERNGTAADELRHVPGVVHVEPFRITGVRVRNGAAWRTAPLTGLPAECTLHRLVDVGGHRYQMPAGGAVLTAGLARVLGVRSGDTIVVELLERGSVARPLVVTGVFDAMTGQNVYMNLPALNAFLREQDAISGAYLSIGAGEEARVFAALKEMPGVAAVTSREATIRNINEQMRDSMVFVLSLIISSATVIAIGVVYNSARIALSERGRELASLRVLGFTTNEIGGILLGEQAVVTVAAIPVGIGIGAVFSFLLTKGFETERFHFPFVLAARSQLFAAGLVVLAGAVAGLMVRGRVRRLDMVAALRTRE